MSSIDLTVYFLFAYNSLIWENLVTMVLFIQHDGEACILKGIK